MQRPYLEGTRLEGGSSYSYPDTADRDTKGPVYASMCCGAFFGQGRFGGNFSQKKSSFPLKKIIFLIESKIQFYERD